MSATQPFIYEGDEVVELERKPGETPEDAYAEYIKRRREEVVAEKIGSLSLTIEELKSIGNLIVGALEQHKDLPKEDQRFWLSILSSINRSIRDAL